MKRINKISLKNKQTNLELLRIISMLMIIIAHFLYHGEVLYQSSPTSLNNNITTFILIFCHSSVNCYIIISSYFLVKSKFNLKKIILLWMEVAFYLINIYLLMVLFSIIPFNIKKLIFSFFPLSTDQYWFFTNYFGLYLIFPFLNIIIEKINKQLHKKIIIIGSILLCILPNIIFFGNILNINNGRSLLWFIYLYFIGAYLRLYEEDNHKKYFKLCFLINIVAFLINFILKIILIYITGKTRNYNLFISCNSITSLFISIYLFLTFKNITIKNDKINKWISILAPLTFGVYLIHDNNYIRNFLWKDVIQPTKYMDNYQLWIVLIISVFVIYVICSSIEYLRAKLFSLLKTKKIAEWIEKKITDILNKLLQERGKE